MNPHSFSVSLTLQQAQILEQAYKNDKNARVILEARVRKRHNSQHSSSTSSSSSSSSSSFGNGNRYRAASSEMDSDMYEIKKFEVSLADMMQTSLQTRSLQTVRRIKLPLWQRKRRESKWVPFFQGNSDEIERSYFVASHGRTSIVEGGKLYMFNLSSNPMVQETGVVTGPERAIRREVVVSQQIKLKITNSSTGETRLVVIPKTETFPSLISRLKQMYASQVHSSTLQEFQEHVHFSYIDGHDAISIKDQFDLDSLMKLGRSEVLCQITFDLLQLPAAPETPAPQKSTLSSAIGIGNQMGIGDQSLMDAHSSSSSISFQNRSSGTYRSSNNSNHSSNITPVDLNEILTGSGSDPSFGEGVSPVQAPILQPKKVSPQSRTFSTSGSFVSQHNSSNNSSSSQHFFLNSNTQSNSSHSSNSSNNSSNSSPYHQRRSGTDIQGGSGFFVAQKDHSPSYMGMESSTHMDQPITTHQHVYNIPPENTTHGGTYRGYAQETENDPFPSLSRPVPPMSKAQLLVSPMSRASSSSSRSSGSNQGNFKLLEQLGKGSYGRVFKVRKQNTGQIAAVKQIPLPKDSRQVQSIEREISLMENLTHDCIVQYSGTERNEKYIYIFMEYCSEGSLQQMLDKESIFPEPLIKAYTKQILEGLAYLHTNNIVHRDLKCGNILVDHLGKLKLADFGCSKIIRELESQQMHSFKGTIHFMAPEVVDHAYYSDKSDIWALGVMLIQMLTGKPPFIHYADRMQLMNCIRNLKQPPAFPTNISEELRQFLSSCLAINPEERKSCQELLQTRFILSDMESNSRNSSENFVRDPLTSINYETYEESIPFSDDETM